MAAPPSGTRPSSDVDAGALERARTLLATWLPGRAAEHVLTRCLQAAGLEPGAIDGERFAAMLLGPVYRELRSTVPRATLRRELKRLARELRAEARPPVASVAPDAPGDDRGDRPADVSDGATPSPPSADTVTPPVATLSDPDDVAMALAVLDGVDGVASYDPVGRTLALRGEVADAEGLGRVLAASGRLLSRQGALRSVTVVTTDGTLVAVSVSERWIAVSGAPDMNLGAVYAALSALEEER